MVDYLMGVLQQAEANCLKFVGELNRVELVLRL